MIDKLLLLLGTCECNEDTAEMCLELAQAAVLDYIGRSSLPKTAESIVIKLAVIYYNRLGNEGESSRTEGGISQSFVTDIPEDIKRQLHNYPRKVGVIHAPVEE